MITGFPRSLGKLCKFYTFNGEQSVSSRDVFPGNRPRSRENVCCLKAPRIWETKRPWYQSKSLSNWDIIETDCNWQQSLRITRFLFIAKFLNFLAVDWIVQAAKMPSLLPLSGIFTCIYDLGDKGRSHCKWVHNRSHPKPLYCTTK